MFVNALYDVNSEIAPSYSLQMTFVWDSERADMSH